MIQLTIPLASMLPSLTPPQAPSIIVTRIGHRGVIIIIIIINEKINVAFSRRTARTRVKVLDAHQYFRCLI